MTEEERRIQYAKLVFATLFTFIGGLLIWLLWRKQKHD